MGGFNRSSQHLEREVSDGTTGGVDVDADRQTASHTTPVASTEQESAVSAATHAASRKHRNNKEQRAGKQ